MAEFTPRLAKYEQIVNTLQARITDGTYPPGSMLPSETEVMAEFGVARPTAARAFEYLRLHKWIDTQPGKGRFARQAPAPERRMPGNAAVLVADEVDAQSRIVDVAEVPAPPRAASALEIDLRTPVVARRRLTTVPGLGPIELVTTYVPLDIADGTDVGGVEPLPDGLLRHLADRKGIGYDYATERTSARQATTEESTLLEIGRRDAVLTVLYAVHDQVGRPVVALDLVLPPTRHELEDSFPVVL